MAITLNRKSFVSSVTDWLNGQRFMLENDLREGERNIEIARREIAKREFECSNLRLIVESLKDSKGLQKIMDALPTEWRRIRGNPHVAGVALVGKGIHLTTKPVSISSNGTLYSVGRFVIRISKSGAFFIWNLDRLHPEGVPHPHISREGTPCLGNASSAIHSAFAEYRYADGVDYLLKWLTEGYEEKLALHKATEWPEVK